MKAFPILYWPYQNSVSDDYSVARRLINSAAGVMPQVIKDDLDISDILQNNPGATIYYPVCTGSTGWWGELLGSDGIVSDKLIVSASCQLMVIKSKDSAEKNGKNQLFAAEIYPSSSFFKKMNSSIATVTDMLATDAGTILALFSGKNRGKFINILESTGNSFLGCIGRY